MDEHREAADELAALDREANEQLADAEAERVYWQGLSASEAVAEANARAGTWQ